MVHELLAGELGHDVVHLGLTILDLEETLKRVLVKLELLQGLGLQILILWLDCLAMSRSFVLFKILLLWGLLRKIHVTHAAMYLFQLVLLDGSHGGKLEGFLP